MSVIYCHSCDRYIDTDYDVEHEEEFHPEEPEPSVRMAIFDNREVW